MCNVSKTHPDFHRQTIHVFAHQFAHTHHAPAERHVVVPNASFADEKKRKFRLVENNLWWFNNDTKGRF